MSRKPGTLLDALCQAIESWWSVNSNEESCEYAKIAVEKIMQNYNVFLCYRGEGSMLAANIYSDFPMTKIMTFISRLTCNFITNKSHQRSKNVRNFIW